MKIRILMMGKTDKGYLEEALAIYHKRLVHYAGLEVMVFPDLKPAKNMSPDVRRNQEGLLLLRQIAADDYVVLLDEKGEMHTSVSFAGFLQQRMNAGIKCLVFVVGGAYGFSPEVYRRADYQLSLSSMTFSHQMVRLFFMEQLYRGFTILRGEPYHNS
ncbi:MAG: 23S rRNA (pseudouridine(1915)-N(3))-methyltransferase RlmH [Bacteroidales bacterium]|nr:23S rRNA (pseudouridine(1915)-N(3))-methyltransferase RlmH [Bacteroidales bacterium]